jgi:hypothetical protein
MLNKCGVPEKKITIKIFGMIEVKYESFGYNYIMRNFFFLPYIRVISVFVVVVVVVI